MRSLLPVPDAVLDPTTGEPRFGSYRGGLSRVDLSPRLTRWRTRVTQHKKWMYLAIAGDDLYIALCVVRLGYAGNAWAFAYDARERRLLVDRSLLTTPFGCTVGDAPGEGCEVRFASGEERMAIHRETGSTSYAVEASVRDLELHVTLDTAGAPPSITAIAPLGPGLVDVTEKRALLEARGEAVIAGRRRSLDGCLAGYDYTNGILARRTAWHWGFLLGCTTTGERVAANLVEGFAGEAECAVWLDGEVHPLGEGRFTLGTNPLDPWTIRDGGRVDLRFEPGATHVEQRNLGVVSSRFVHPIGTFTGSIDIAGRRVSLANVLGVTEDQDVTW